jgi:hypothetical protein
MCYNKLYIFLIDILSITNFLNSFWVMPGATLVNVLWVFSHIFSFTLGTEKEKNSF